MNRATQVVNPLGGPLQPLGDSIDNCEEFGRKFSARCGSCCRVAADWVMGTLFA
jgi:hypothetical protein